MVADTGLCWSSPRDPAARVAETLVYGLYSGGRVTVRLQQEAENVP